MELRYFLNWGAINISLLTERKTVTFHASCVATDVQLLTSRLLGFATRCTEAPKLTAAADYRPTARISFTKTLLPF